MKYKAGDKVRIRCDIDEDETYFNDDGHESNTVNSDMLEMAGKVVTISGIDYGQYRIEECGWLWVDEMFDDNGEEIEQEYTDISLEDFLRNL